MQLCQLEGPGMVRALKLEIPRARSFEIGHARLRVTWDGRGAPSIDAPLALFFGAGAFYNRDGREYLVKAFPMNVRYQGKTVTLACYFPMPFFRRARIELTEVDPAWNAEVAYEVRHERYTGPANHVGLFHATYRDHPAPELGKDLVLLDTEGTEGGTDDHLGHPGAYREGLAAVWAAQSSARCRCYGLCMRRNSELPETSGRALRYLPRAPVARYSCPMSFRGEKQLPPA